MTALYADQYDEVGDQYDTGPIPMISVTGTDGRQAKSVPVINEEKEDDEDDLSSKDEEENDEEQYLVWKIYDKLIAAFTSEFVVLNLCRLGL